jgi:ATP-binding cassette subfamily C protein CydD
LPQLVSASISVPVLLLVFVFTDPISAGLVAVTLLLIPVFMMLIGWATRAVQNRQWRAMQQLNSHFLELLRGMLTLKVFGREKRQGIQIEAVNEKYRVATMRVLRVSFLSGFALELFSSLSVAIVAVSIGLRLLDGTMLLGLALFVLILAPELFSPIRAVGANFHAASEGIQAAEDIFQILDSVVDVAGSNEEIELGLGVIQVTGESGSGKSTLIEELVGVRESARFSKLGTSKERMSKCAWMPQRSVLLPSDNVHDQIVFGCAVDNEILKMSVEIAVLDDVDLHAPISADGRGFSGGQIQRIALARTLYRFFHANCEILVLDEPTSSIDDKRVKQFSANLKNAMHDRGRLVIASHDPRFSFEATQVVRARV